MVVKELTHALGMVNLTHKGEDREIKGAYACDLLSRVMSGCKENDAWITVQTHLNVIAVATLNEPACIIIPEGIPVGEETIQKAAENNIPLLSSEMKTYDICWQIHRILT